MDEGAREVAGRVIKHLEELAEQRESFDRVSSRVGQLGFIAAWSRTGTPEQVDLKGSEERAYEQIVNDLHGMFDVIEREAHRHGFAPKPGITSTAWWDAAAKLGIDVSQSLTSQTPGRWRRLALYGFLDHGLVTDLNVSSSSRDLFQHAYAQRTPERGAEVWAVMSALMEDLSVVGGGIVAFHDEVKKKSARSR